MNITGEMTLAEAREHIQRQCLLMTNSIDMQLAEHQLQEVEPKVHLKHFIEEIHIVKDEIHDMPGMHLTEEEKLIFPEKKDHKKLREEMAKMSGKWSFRGP